MGAREIRQWVAREELCVEGRAWMPETMAKILAMMESRAPDRWAGAPECDEEYRELLQVAADYLRASGNAWHAVELGIRIGEDFADLPSEQSVLLKAHVHDLLTRSVAPPAPPAAAKPEGRAPFCESCGYLMMRDGAGWLCRNCGHASYVS